MKNLEGKKFKDFLKTNIRTALELHNEPDLTIKFKFIDEKCKLNKLEKFSTFAGYVYYKNVFLGDTLNNNTIDLMVKNLNYDNFSYVDMLEEHTPTTCHGHGDYWGSDTYIFVYKRF